MGKTKDPAFLFYPQDFLVGTMTMSDEQIGQYIKLLCLQHAKGGKLTERDILKITRTRDDDIFSKFAVDEEGNYFNQRLLDEVNKRIEHSIKQKENIMKRWNKEKETNVIPPYNNGNTSVLPLENENEDVIVNKGINKSLKKEAIYFDDEILNKTFHDYMYMRKTKIKNGAMTNRAIELAVIKLNKYPTTTAIDMLNESITNNWKGIFELKEDYRNKKTDKVIPKEPSWVDEYVSDLAKMEG